MCAKSTLQHANSMIGDLAKRRSCRVFTYTWRRMRLAMLPGRTFWWMEDTRLIDSFNSFNFVMVFASFERCSF